MKKSIFFSVLCLLCVSHAYAKVSKPADFIWFVMERQSNMDKIGTDSVVLTYQLKHKSCSPTSNRQWDEMRFPQPYVVVTIQNNTARTVLVDLLNSFIIPNHETYPLFTNTTNVSTQGSTTGGGVSIGLVSIGGSSTSSNSTITQENRFISIPGDTRKSIEIPFVIKWGKPWHLEGVDGEMQIHPGSKSAPDLLPDYIALKNNFISRGEVLNYEDADNPFTLDIRICYSFNENFEPKYTDKVVYFTKHIIGCKPIYGNNTGDVGRKEKQIKFVNEVFPDFDSYSKNKSYFVFDIWRYQNF